MDFSGPVVKLASLSAEELFVLLANIRHVHASGDSTKYAVTDEALLAVLRRANEVLGAEYFKTPRDVVRSFVGLLSVLDQNPGAKWQDLVNTGAFIRKAETPTTLEEELAAGIVAPDDTDDLSTLKL